MTVIRILLRRVGRWQDAVASAAGCARAAGGCLVLFGAAAMAETSVTGVEDDLLANVLAHVDIDDLECDARPAVVEQALGRSVAQASEALKAFGYYAPTISTGLERTDDCWLASISIVPGEPVRLRTVDIVIAGPAAPTAPFESLSRNAALMPGMPLNHGAYDNLKRTLFDLARNRGYAEARLEANQIDIYPDELAADVTLHFESGPRYSIGTVSVNQDALEPGFVRAYHELNEGLPYDNRLLNTAFLNLNDSGYFSSVDVRVLPANPESRTIPIEINLTAAPRRVVSYGIGVSTDTGPRFRFGRSNRRFNDRGHQLAIDAQLSPVVSELTSNYRMPIGNPRFEWLNFSLGAKREETDTSLARSIEAGVRRLVDRDRGWSTTQSLNYVFEDFEVGTQKGRPQLLIPGIDWTRIRGDDALRPDNGSKLTFELRAANEQFLSDTSFAQTIVSAKWIRSVTERGRVLLRGRAGYTVEDNFEELPPSIRFFAGGDNSIRGFKFESLGPVDENGNVIGGPRLIELSVEYEHEIKPRWSIALFTDSGNAYNDLGRDMRTGAGIGTRWRSPLGPIRIDLAWPVNDIVQGPRLHVSLGPDL